MLTNKPTNTLKWFLSPKLNLMINKKAVIEPLNLLMGIIAIFGALLIIFNKVEYGLILLIIATLIEAIERLFR